MDYPIIIQAQIRYILDHTFQQIVENIRNQNMKMQSEWQTFTTSHLVTQLKFLHADIQNEIIEDFEQKPLSQENYSSYKITLNEKILSSRMTPSTNQFRKRQIKQDSTFYNWNKDYHYSLIEMPQPEVQISQIDEDLRRMKMQQIIDNNKQREFSLQQLKEKKKEKEKFLRLKQLLNGKQYTYDYNCEPIINKTSQLSQDFVPKLQFEIVKDKKPINKKYKTQKPEIQQQNIKRKSKGQQNSQDSILGESKSFFGNMEDENYDRQTSNIPFIKLSKGVKIREQDLELNYYQTRPQQTEDVRNTTENQFLHQQTNKNKDLEVSQQEIPLKISKSYIKTERNGQILNCDLEEYFFSQQKVKEKIPSTQRPFQMAVIDDFIYKQDVVKLPRVRSRSIHTMNRKNRQILIHSREQIQSFNQQLV